MTLALPRNSETPSQTPLSAAKPRRPRGTDASHPAPDLLAHLAHDARNWLTVLQVYCDLLRTSGAIASGYEPWIEELSGTVERGHGLVDSLVDLVLHSAVDPVVAAEDAIPSREPNATNGGSRGNGSFADTSATDAAPLDVASALSRRLPLLRRMAGNEIHVGLSAPAHAGKVQLPESVFERILYNLVGNAIEAMPHGGRLRIALCPGRGCGAGTGPVAAGEKRLWKTVVLRVTDTGRGIEPDRLPHIFDAGISGKQGPVGHPERHGFGLAIVRELADRAGGEVRVHSEPGRGSRFEVELPKIGKFPARAGKSDIRSKEMQAAYRSSTKSLRSGKGIRVLC